MKYSFIIITYNRPNECIDTLKNIINETDYKQFDSEIIVIDNNSTTNIENLRLFIKNNVLYNIKLYESKKNLGVAGGRNFGMIKSKGDILIFIDDDAIFKNKDIIKSTEIILKKDPTIGIIAFKSYDYYTKKIVYKEFPHHKIYKAKLSNFYTYFFIGVAHIIKKEVFDNIGLYPEDFFYGMEEYDFSYRTLDAGYRIFYSSKFEVFHKNSKLGRKSSAFIIQKYAENKIKVAIRNLPSVYIITHLILWSFKYLKESNFNIINMFIMHKNLFIYLLSCSNRKKISKRTISEIKKLEGILLY